jgi:predicted Rossmann fold flavoprotein
VNAFYLEDEYMVYDVVVIGGGPAGMMAAGQAAQSGASVLLLERNDSMGRKLLATGHGRCNITNLSADSKEGIHVYGQNAKFLLSVFHRFGVADTLDFFASLGIETKTEEQGRVFPRSERAGDVLSALLHFLKESGVGFSFGAEVKGLGSRDGAIEKVLLWGGKEVLAKNFIVCSGGKSYPLTGSKGDGYAWLSALGHTVNCPRPALTPVLVRESYVKELEGLSFGDIELSLRSGQKIRASRRGGILFTADGLSGPAMIDLSREVGALSSSEPRLEIDFFPDMSREELDEKLRSDFHEYRNKTSKNYLSALLAPKLTPLLLRLSGLSGTKPVNAVTREERLAILDLAVPLLTP